MARKTKTISLKDRDKELSFRITELSATSQEKLLFKAGAVLARLLNLGKISPSAAFSHAAGGNFGGLNLSLLRHEELYEISNELLSCCERVIKHGSKTVYEQVEQDGLDAYIEDVSTIFTLKKEAFLLSFDFLQDALLSFIPHCHFHGQDMQGAQGNTRRNMPT